MRRREWEGACGAWAPSLALRFQSLSHAPLTPHPHPPSSLGVLSTLSASGAPSGSVVQYATDPATSRLILSLSTLSAHTRELAADGRCSLTVLSPWGFGSMADARVTLGGLLAAPLPASEAARARAAYLAAHPDAFWADFGDFAWWGLDPATPGAATRAVLGFGRAGSVPGPAWAATPVDPVSAFSAPVCGHMNADHGDAVVAMVASTGLPGRVVGAAMRKVDALGFDAVAQVAVEEDGEKKGGRPMPPVSVPVRVPFPRRADGRKELKEVLVELTKAAKGGG